MSGWSWPKWLTPRGSREGGIPYASLVEDPVCPNCGGTRFLEGPHGGVAVNVKCEGCGDWWNWGPGAGLMAIGGTRLRVKH